ncbi:MAG: hypothetical protein HY049_04320 [Acidobacteria bacterium]|nr:hypothetical protein [Acidobacteriota bacterium]
MTRAAWLALVAAVAGLGLAAPARAATCTKELRPPEFAGSAPFSMTCGTVEVTLRPIESEMFYHRWLVNLDVRSIGTDGEARVNLAAFDALGDLIGAHGVAARDLHVRPRSMVFRMEAMYRSTADTAKVLMSVSLPEKKSR